MTSVLCDVGVNEVDDIRSDGGLEDTGERDVLGGDFGGVIDIEDRH